MNSAIYRAAVAAIAIVSSSCGKVPATNRDVLLEVNGRTVQLVENAGGLQAFVDQARVLEFSKNGLDSLSVPVGSYDVAWTNPNEEGVFAVFAKQRRVVVISRNGRNEIREGGIALIRITEQRAEALVR